MSLWSGENVVPTIASWSGASGYSIRVDQRGEFVGRCLVDLDSPSHPTTPASNMAFQAAAPIQFGATSAG